MVCPRDAEQHHLKMEMRQGDRSAESSGRGQNSLLIGMRLAIIVQRSPQEGPGQTQIPAYIYLSGVIQLRGKYLV